MIRLRVKEVAQEKGFSQGRLSRAANVDPKTLSTIFRNPQTDIRLSTLDRLSKALQVPPHELFVQLED